MKVEAAFVYDALDTGELVCGICRRRCVIGPNEEGWCHALRNEDGKLYSLTYGEVASLSIMPVEKYPVFHYNPGARWFAVGSVGCNFRCPGCQEWENSHWVRGSTDTHRLTPEELVAQAVESGCTGISWMFNEPTAWFEYTLDCSSRAKARYLNTGYCTNGYLTPEAFDLIAPFLDVYRVDIKAFRPETYRKIGHIDECSGIFDQTELARARGVHVEVVTNIIPGVNDDPEEWRSIARWISESLGPETPWHITRFHPHHEFRNHVQTPVETLEAAWSIGKEAGLWYVYLGNVPGHRHKNTYCHRCDELLIERYAFDVVRNEIRDNRCPGCSTLVSGTF